MTPSETDTSSTASPKSSSLQRMMKWLAIVGMLLFVLLIGVGLFLTYWFPSDIVRQELEGRLSEVLKGSVRIQTLSFNLLTGLSLEHVEFEQGPQPVVELDRLVLDYSLWGLLERKLTINEIRIDGADLSLNLVERQQAETIPVPEPLPPAEPKTLPPLPLMLDLEALIVSRTNIDLNVSPSMAVQLRDLALEVSGGVTKEVAELKGNVAVAQVGVDLEEKQLRFPFDLDFAVQADLLSQDLMLEEVRLSLERILTLTLAGQIDAFLDSPSVDLSLTQSRVDLERLLALIEDFLPPEFRHEKVFGTVMPTVSVKGGMGDLGFNGEVTAHTIVKSLQTELAQFHVSVEPSDIEVRVTDLVVKNNQPAAGTIKIHVQSPKAAFQAYEVEGLDFQAAGDYFAVGPVSTMLTVSGKAHIPPQGPLTALVLPFALQLDGSANYRTQDVTLKQLEGDIENIGHIHLQGNLTPLQHSSQTRKLNVNTRIEPYFERLLPLVPQDLLGNLEIEKLAAADFITAEVESTLDAQYQPLELEASVGVNVSNVMVKENSLSAEGTLDEMNLALTTQYNAESETMRGTLSGTVNLMNLAYQSLATVGTVGMAFDTTFNGRMSRSFEIRDLVSEQNLNLFVRNAHYTTPTLGMEIEEVSLSADFQEDLTRQWYKIEALRLTSPSLLEMQASAKYILESQDFDLLVEIPSVQIGEWQRRLSGTAVQALGEINPEGTASLTVSAAGRVPKEEDIQRLDIPVSLNATLSFDEVAGGFADYRVENGGGTVAFSFEPGERPTAKVESDLRIGEVALAPGLPLEQVVGMYANINMLSENFDLVDVNTCRIGMKGLDVSLVGSVGGIRDLIEGKQDVMASLPDLFAHMNTKVRVTLDEFQQVLQPLGLTSSGGVHVGLSLLKKERGPVSLDAVLGNRDVTIVQDGTRAEHIQGQMRFRKRLNWLDHSSRTSGRAFRPTDLLSQLRTMKEKERSLTIARLDIGGLSITDLVASIGFDQDAFKVQNLAMNLLDGGIGGNLMVMGGKAFGLMGRFEAARLDLNQLLEEKVKISGDSRVDAIIDLSVFFEEESGKLDMSRTNVNLFIPHIGSEAVDRLLVFLDPEGSNPTLVSARSQITFANPSNVLLQLNRGMLNLEIHFSEGVLPPFILKRIPIGKIKTVKTITAGIPDWDNVRKIMDVIGAESYGVDEKGKLVFQ